jgi:hypothetical protein
LGAILFRMNTYVLPCKVCDRGSLGSKKVFRMSGPVVAIGFILLIPSILGMVFSAILLIGVNAITNRIHEQTQRPSQNPVDAKFRKSCRDAFLEKQAQYLSANKVSASQFCECVLSTYKENGSVDVRGASQTCAEEGVNGTLKEPDSNVQAFYEDASTQSAATDDVGQNIARFIGSGFAIALGIGSFVGGLLGWLLVMRKRVLKCDVCGAVINAS